MMEQGAVWLGIDIGTTSVKASVTDNDGLELVSKTENTNADVKSDVGEIGFEQCPQKILKIVEDTIQLIASSYQSRIKGIGISGQMHGVVLWRKTESKKNSGSTQNTEVPSQSKSLHDCVCHTSPSHLYTWQDQRCTPTFLATLPSPSNSKLPLSTGHGCATLFWLLRNQAVTLEEGQFDCCGTIMDYLVYLLCGLDHPVTSDHLAASLGYFNQQTMGWDSALGESPEFPAYLMPTVVKAGSKVGITQPSFSVWPSGVPVLVGMGDVQCAMGAVLKSPHQAVNISTSIQLGFLVPSKDLFKIEKQSQSSISFFPYFDEHHLALCAGLNGGNAVQHFVECVANWMKDLGFNEDACTLSSVFTKLHALATEDLCQGNENEPSSHNQPLTVRPTFYGERHSPSLNGQISNISLTNFQNIGLIYRSLCEGVVNHLGSMVPPSYLCDMKIEELIVCGSVPVKNPFIKNALKNVYGRGNLFVNVENMSKNQASSAVGAARIAENVLKF